jgi:hypothetical protein
MNLFVYGLSISILVLLGAILKPKIQVIGKLYSSEKCPLSVFEAFPTDSIVCMFFKNKNSPSGY